MNKQTIETYKKYGINVKNVLKSLKKIKISIHCWQLDDVNGFENSGPLTGGIQSTGNYPYRANNFEELTSDLDKALSYIPGTKKINLHASYQSDDVVDRKDISPKQFVRWVEYAKERNLGLDFNPTIFASDKLVDGLSLSSPNKEVRDY